jgi:hypothetical protein
VTVPAGATPDDDVRGGAAMQRVWIAAQRAGLAVQPVVPLFLHARTDAELAELAGPYTARLAAARQRLRELLGVGPDREFAMLLRLAYAPPPTMVSLRSTDTAVAAGR